MKAIALWIEEDYVVSQRFRVVPSTLHLVLRPANTYTLDHRYKAPRKQLSRRLRLFINAHADNSTFLVINKVNNPNLLWRKVHEQLEQKTVTQVFIVPARDMNHLIQKFSKKMINTLVNLGG